MGIEQTVVATRRGCFAALGCLLAGEILLRLEHLDHLDHRLRIVATTRQVLRAQAIGLQLHVAPIAAHERITHGAGQIPHCADTSTDSRSLPEQAPGRGLTLLAHAMAGRDVTHFVTQYSSQLRLGIQISEQATMDIDVAPRQGEGVDVRAVHQGENVVELIAMAAACYPLADALNISLQFGVLIARVLLEDFLVVARPELQLLALTHHHEVVATRGRIDRATCQPAADQAQHQCTHHGNTSSIAE